MTSSESIAPGKYTLTIETKNEARAKVTLKRNFVIAKNGEQVLGVATEEAKKITPTLVSPTIYSPTSAPVITPILPSPTVSYVLPTTEPTTLLKSGYNIQNSLVFGSSLLIIG
jgi:hypothetical protein